MIQREENTTYIATISGGKDSVTMCDLLLKNGYPVDWIVFSDTLIELPQMYEYIDKLKEYFLNRYGNQITITKPLKTFEEMIFGIIKQKGADKIGYIRGLPNPMLGFCEWRRESKIYPFDRFLREKNIKKYKTYIGFTLDEKNRKSNDENLIYPLIDFFSMTERNCQEYLMKQDMENPLYRHFSRTGCGGCPAQSDKSFFEVWKNYKSYWEFMVYIEKRLNHYEDVGYSIVNKYWFDGKRTCKDMEKMFKEKDKQGSLFDFSDEPLKDCFCKI